MAFFTSAAQAPFKSPSAFLPSLPMDQDTAPDFYPPDRDSLNSSSSNANSNTNASATPYSDMATMVVAQGGAANMPGPLGVGKRYRPAPAKTFQCRGYGECRMVFSRSEHLARHIRYSVYSLVPARGHHLIRVTFSQEAHW